MDPMLAERMKRIGLSPTLKMAAKARQMADEGIDVVDLSVGEPDFPTPRHIRQAAARAMEAGYTKYTATPGVPELRQAIAAKLRRDNGLDYDWTKEIIVSTGAKNSLFHLLVAVVNKGEEVIFPAPYWVSYPEMVSLAKGVPVIVPTREEDGFLLTPEALDRAINANTKALILNHPCNPTGSHYPKDRLYEICRLAADEGLIIIADEIYEKLLYDGREFVSVASLSPKIRERSVVINGVSKAYSMTGWRIGYAAGPEEVIRAMTTIQSHSTSNPCSVSQMAALEALEGPQDEIQRMKEEFVRRRNYMYSRLMTIPGISCHKPEGAFYLFPNFEHYYPMVHEGAEIRNSAGMAYHLLKHGHVATVAGSAFGADLHIRLSYATSMERIEEAMDRIADAVSKLTPTRRAKKKALMNTVTRVRKDVPLDARIPREERDALVAEADRFLSDDVYFEWNANISGLVVQLRTNSPHLSDFFVENWYPSPLESDIEPHGILYAVNWIPGREAEAFYNSESRTGFLFKSAYYGQLRSLALGLVMDVAERIHDLHGVRGMCADVGGRGVLLLAPPGTGKSGHMAELLKRADARLVSLDSVFVRYQAGEALADTPERKFYVQTNLVGEMPALTPLLERSKCENVVTTLEEHRESECPDGDACPLERGGAYCFKANRRSRAMLDPYWIGGTGKHVRRTSIRNVIFLRKDPIARPVEKLDPETALRHLEEARDASGRELPFLNPHLLAMDMERVEAQRRFFRKLFDIAPVHALNVARLTSKEAHRSTREILGI